MNESGVRSTAVVRICILAALIAGLGAVGVWVFVVPHLHYFQADVVLSTAQKDAGCELPSATTITRALIQARERFVLQEYADALAILGEIDAGTPEEKASMLILRGQCSEGSGIGNAYDAYRKALSTAPDVAESRLRLGVLKYKMGNPDEAKTWLEEYVSVSPGNPEAACYLYLVYAMLDVDGQEKCLRDVVLLDGPDGYWMRTLKSHSPSGG